MRKVGWALAAPLVLMAPQVGAQAINGNQLHEACNGGVANLEFFCVGYITGTIEGAGLGAALPIMHAGNPTAVEATNFANTILMYCLPADGINEQYIDVVSRYLADNPQLRHESARMNIMFALQEAFPCPTP